MCIRHHFLGDGDLNPYRSAYLMPMITITNWYNWSCIISLKTRGMGAWILTWEHTSGQWSQLWIQSRRYCIPRLLFWSVQAHAQKAHDQVLPICLCVQYGLLAKYQTWRVLGQTRVVILPHILELQELVYLGTLHSDLLSPTLWVLDNHSTSWYQVMYSSSLNMNNCAIFAMIDSLLD